MGFPSQHGAVGRGHSSEECRMYLAQWEGVKPEAKHVHPVLKAYALGGSIEIMQEYTLRSLALNDDIDIDVECYNWLLRVTGPPPPRVFLLRVLVLLCA